MAGLENPRKTGRASKKPNWVELPSEITENILNRLGFIQILVSAQMVCSSWYKICKDPSMWRVIDMKSCGDLSVITEDIIKKLMKIAVNRSQGQLVDVTIESIGSNELMELIADRSSQLRRLQVMSRCYSIEDDCMSCCFSIKDASWSNFFKKAPLLEELRLISTYISAEALGDATRYCPMLKSFKYKSGRDVPESKKADPRLLVAYSVYNPVEDVIAIAGGMTQLRHLEIGSFAIRNEHLKSILDCFPQLESLDLGCCGGINLDGELKERCTKQIKNVELPEDYLEDFEEALDGVDENFIAFLEDFDFSDLFPEDLDY